MTMKTTPRLLNRHDRLRQAALRRLAEVGPLIEGSLCSFKRRRCSTPGWQLTFRKRGRTRTVYVPMDMVREVQAWIRAHRRLKQIIRKITTHSLALIRGHVAARQAAARAQALNPGPWSRNSTPSRRVSSRTSTRG